MAEIPRIVIKSRSGQPNPFIEHIKNTYERNPFDPREFVTKEGDAAFEVSSINENEARINSIRSFEKGKGAGSNVLNLLENLADEFKVELTGTAEPFGQKGFNKKKLLDFYKRHGWISKYPDDPLRSDELYRLPQARKDLSPEETPISTGLVNVLKFILKNVGKGSNPVSAGLQAMKPKKVADATLEGNPEVQAGSKAANPISTALQVLSPTEVADATLPKDFFKDVLYHGTTADIKGGLKYSKEGVLGEGIYLTPDSKYASSYAEGEGGSVLPVKTNINNPLIVDIPKGQEPAAHVLNKLGVNKDKAFDIAEKAFEEKGNITKEISSRARKQGYDAIVLRVDGKVQEILAYNPKAIKSIFTNKRGGGSVIMRNPYDYQPRGI